MHVVSSRVRMALVITVLHEVLLRELAPPLGGHLVRARARARVRVRFRVRVRVSLRLAATRLRESHRPMWNTCRVRVRARVRVRVMVGLRGGEARAQARLSQG